MDFEPLSTLYKENDSDISSPLWIWFDKVDTSASCKICNTKVPRKDGSTGGLVHHLKRHHNFVSKYNAWKVFEELSLIKDKQLQIRKRKNDTSTDERPTKQQKLVNCLPMKYSNQHIKITNSIGSVICNDAAPVNIVKRPVSRSTPSDSIPFMYYRF